VLRYFVSSMQESVCDHDHESPRNLCGYIEGVLAELHPRWSSHPWQLVVAKSSLITRNVLQISSIADNGCMFHALGSQSDSARSKLVGAVDTIYGYATPEQESTKSRITKSLLIRRAACKKSSMKRGLWPDMTRISSVRFVWT
jgi:hypothetical protein